MWYRVLGVLSASGGRSVLFEGSAMALKEQFPVASFPRPLNGHLEDILGGRGGTLIYFLEEAQIDVRSKSPPDWKITTADPRFART